MSSLPTPNVATWMANWSATILQHYQLSVSLDEKITLMEVFTSTLSWISADAWTSATLDGLMLKATTRTYNHAVAHLKKCATMRSRTETLLQEGSTPSSTIQFRELTLSGIELQMRRLLMSFGNLLDSWLHERFSATSTPFGPSQSGTIDPRQLHTSTPVTFESTHREHLNLMRGYVTTCLELVSAFSSGGDPAAREPSPPPSGRSVKEAIFCDDMKAEGAKHPLPSRFALQGGPPPLGERYANTLIVGRPRSLIVWGETRLGKTVWARSLGSHVYCCLQWNVDDLKAGLEDAKYAVLDDIQGNFQFFPSYKGWLGGQQTFTVTDKYRGKTTINWGRPTIWLMNEDPEEVGHVDLNWLRGNCDIVHLTEPIVHSLI